MEYTALGKSGIKVSRICLGCDFKVVDRLSALAEKRGVSNAQLALAWIRAKPGVTAPIIGATKPHHVQDAVNALTLRLEPAEMAQLEEPYQPHPILGHV